MNYFREVAPLLAAATRDQAAIGEVVARHRLDIDFTTIPTLAAARPAPGVACAGGRARRSGRGGGEVEVETWDAIRSRRNVRSYREQAIAPEDLARRLLGLPGDRFCAWLVSLGVPADRPLSPIRRPNRRPFDEVVHRGHW